MLLKKKYSYIDNAFLREVKEVIWLDKSRDKHKSVKCGFEEQCKRSSLSPQVCNRDIKPIASTEALLGRGISRYEISRCLLVYSYFHGFFSLWPHLWCGWGKKKRTKMLQAKPSSCLQSPKVQHFIVWEVLIVWNLHIVYGKKRKFSIKKRQFVEYLFLKSAGWNKLPFHSWCLPT